MVPDWRSSRNGYTATDSAASSAIPGMIPLSARLSGSVS